MNSCKEKSIFSESACTMTMTMTYREIVEAVVQIDRLYHSSQKVIPPHLEKAAKENQIAQLKQLRQQADNLTKELLENTKEQPEIKPLLDQILNDILVRCEIVNREYKEVPPHPDAAKYGKYYSQQRYEALLPFCQLAYISEKNGSPEEHALKLSLCFDDPFAALKMINIQSKKNKFPVHDACLFQLPDVNQCNFEMWKKKIMTNMDDPSIFRILPKATEIETLFNQNIKKAHRIDRNEIIKDKKNLAQAISRFKDLRSKRIKARNMLNAKDEAEYQALQNRIIPELNIKLYEISAGISLKEADLVTLGAYDEYYRQQTSGAYRYMLDHGLTKNDYIKFCNLTRVNDDIKIPNIKLDGKDLGCPGTYLMKVDVEDEMQAARAACFGKLTSCCQSLSGEAGEPCVFHGLTSPYGGFYVLCQGDINNPKIEDPVLGQCWAWRSTSNAIVFDSIEVSAFVPNSVPKRMFESLANKLCDENFTNKVACGASSGISSLVGVAVPNAKLELKVDYHLYSDSSTQRIIVDKEHPYYFLGASAQMDQTIADKLNVEIAIPGKVNQNEYICKALEYAIVSKNIALQNLIIKIASQHGKADDIQRLTANLKSYIDGNVTIDQLGAVIEDEYFYINVKNRNGDSPLKLAVINGQLDLVKRIIALNPDLDDVDNDVQTVLMHAAQAEQEEILNFLLESGADIHKRNRFGYTPLLVAIVNSKNNTAKILIEKESREHIDDKDAAGYSALIHATSRGLTELTQLLAAKGADVNLQGPGGNTPLLSAVQYSTEEKVMLLIKELPQLDLTIKNYTGISPLMMAAQKGHSQVAQLLYDKGAKIEEKDSVGCSALIYAVKGNHPALISWLVKSGADINEQNSNQETPLMYAIVNGHEDLALSLIEQGAKVDLINKNGKTVLMLACAKGQTKVVQKLLDLKVDINIEDHAKETALAQAIRNGHEELAGLLVKNGAQISTITESGETLLMLACGKGLEKVALSLIEQGANLEAVDKNNETALMYAVKNKHIALARVLIEKGALADIVDAQGVPLLRHAIKQGNVDLIKAILQNAPKASLRVESSDLSMRNGLTLLMTEVLDDNQDIVKYILELAPGCALVRLESGDYVGHHPLSLAVDCNKPAMAKLITELVPSAASLPIETRYEKGLTPLFVAIGKNNVEMLTAILEGAPEAANFIITEGADYNIGHNALTYAIDHRKVEVAKLLIDKIPKLAFQIKAAGSSHTIGLNALYLAIKEPKIIEYILEKIPELAFETVGEGYCKGLNILNYAITNNSKSEIPLLIIDRVPMLASELISEGANKGLNAVHFAILERKYDIALQILAKQPDLRNVPVGKDHNWSGMTPLLIAIGNGNLELVKKLIELGADLETKDDSEYTPLLLAVSLERINLDIVKALLEAGADLEAKEYRGETPLMKMVKGGDLNLMLMLVEQGADIHVTNKEGLSAVDLANKTNSEFGVAMTEKARQMQANEKASRPKALSFINRNKSADASKPDDLATQQNLNELNIKPK